MDLIYANREFQDIGALKQPEIDLAFGSDENDFECKIALANHCCDRGYLIYAEGTEYGGMVDNIGIDSKTRTVTYSGRTWHGILGSKVILPLQADEATGGEKLPDGFTELEYLASTGTQYVDTGFKPNQDTRVVMEFQLSDDIAEQTPLHARYAASKDSFGIFRGSNAWYADYGTVRSPFPTSITTTERLLLDFNKSVVSLNGNVLTLDSQTFTAPVNLAIFARNTNGTINNYAIGRIYSCKIYDTDVLIRNYVPCLDASNVACLYDKVTKTAYYNAGTGSFIPGYKLPEGYTEVEYIESSGTQYIDAGFKPNQNTRVVMDFELISASANYRSIFGVRDTVSDTSPRQFVFWNYPSDIFRTDYFGTNQTISGLDRLSRMTVDKNKNVTTIAGTTTTNTANTGQCTLNLYLLSINEAGNALYHADAKLYSSQAYDNVTPIRDYVPVTDANGVACAFDRIGNLTYYNAGSGSFTAGAAVESSGSSGGSSGIIYSENVTVEGETTDGESLVDRYLIISGDANSCIGFVLNRIGLPEELFVPAAEESGVMVTQYRFARYADAYTGLRAMLASVGMRLSIVHENGFVTLSAVPAIDYSQTKEFEAALIPYETKAYLNKPNHLVCLGSGELENRIVVHLYMDADGNISETQTFTGLDEYTAVYDYPNVAAGEDVTEEDQRADLIESATQKFKELQTPDEIDIDFDISDDSYYIGDIIGTYDQETDLFVSAVIYKKIVTVKNGLVNVSYNEG